MTSERFYGSRAPRNLKVGNNVDFSPTLSFRAGVFKIGGCMSLLQSPRGSKAPRVFRNFKFCN